MPEFDTDNNDCKYSRRPCIGGNYCEGDKCAQVLLEALPVRFELQELMDDKGIGEEIFAEDKDLLEYIIDEKRKLGPGNSN